MRPTFWNLWVGAGTKCFTWAVLLQFLAIKHMAITIAVDADLIQIGLGRLGSGGLIILKAHPWVH